MKRRAAIISVTCLMGVLAFSHMGAASEGLGATGSSHEWASGPTSLKSDVVGKEAVISPGSLTPSNVFRDIPTQTTRFEGPRSCPISVQALVRAIPQI